MITYLEVTETGLPEFSTVGVNIRVEVASKEEASILRDELVTRFFSGKTHEDKLHYHHTNQPCTTEILP